MKKEIKVIENDMAKIHDLGIVKGRMEMVNELIDLHDGGTEFLQALKEVQAKNGDMMAELNKKSL